jgi:hypothetical protein
MFEKFSSADISGNDTIDDTQVVSFVSQIFRNSGLQLLATFLIIYLVVFVLFGMYVRRNEQETADLKISKTFDFSVFGCLFVFAIYKYFRADDDTKSDLLKAFTQELVEYFDDPLSLFSTMMFVVCFYLIVFILGIPTKDNKPFSVSLMQVFGWLLLGALVIHNILKYFFEIDLLDELRDVKWKKYIDPDANEDASGNVVEEEKPKVPEVFNISNNKYTYNDAQAICKAFDSRLANYDEIETAYQNGAEWCNYGWSADQMAFFPTQKKTWQELQNSEKHKNSCGRPGVNGGFFANPYIKFGVNCFGTKPDPKQNELAVMETRKLRPYPRTEEEKQLDETVAYWKEQLQGNVALSGFNRDQWSRY